MKTASLAGPSRTMIRWARSSLRHVWAPSVVVSPGTRPTTSPRKVPKRGGVGDLDAEVGELEFVVHRALLSTRWVWIVPMPSIVETSSSPGARNRGGVRVPPTPDGVPVKMRSPGQQRRDRRQEVDQRVDAEDQVGRAALLHLLAVDRAAQRQVVGVGELVGR